jgi:hypothetical protein
MRARSWVARGAVLLTLGACANNASTPESAYAAFAKAFQQGDADGVLHGLSSASQERLRAQARALEQTTGGRLKLQPIQMLVPTAEAPAPVTEVKRVSSDGGHAVVQVSTATGSTLVQLTYEQRGWKVELPETPKTAVQTQHVSE